ncbi:hypothetical protein SAMN05216552_1020118 [Pseudoduganella namucuonensis]|uniref:DUF6396 domain-containing protein n=2 Tax=Pseudoduganella namucuonensis TaxID=1035707 RepID=A0A1I7KX28_9BURK|nr:hypothetical protein SAMN05216552_1020118 [Pseudoduganella namucuonensis]
MHAIPDGLRNFDAEASIPICGRWKDHMPRTRNAEVFHSYMEARKLWRSKIEWQLTRQEAMHILTSVESASKKGDWGARALMAYFYRTGLGPLPSNNVLKEDINKSVEIVRQGVAAGQPWAFYDLGVAHHHGYGDAVYNQDFAWAYFLKAAELGSPDAQLALADAYGKAGRLEEEREMVHCAYQQGHGEAAYRLAIEAEVQNRLKEALSLYQDGVRFGCDRCASSLSLLFGDGNRRTSTEQEKDEFKQLGVFVDLDREKRYREISDALVVNPDLKFSRLDEFLPLPPAKLPEWRGVSDVITPEPDGPPTY